MLVYADSSALVKLVLDEAESAALERYLESAELASSELVLTEVQRAVVRVAAAHPNLSSQALLERVGIVLDSLAFVPLDRPLLVGAGALAEPALRSLDAIHVASAVGLGPVDAFVTYDKRQSAAARLAGLKTMSPGV